VKTLLLVLRVVALVVVLFVAHAVAGSLAGFGAERAGDRPATALESPRSASADGIDLFLTLLLVCLLETLVLAWPILRSRWSGLRLMSSVFVIMFGVMTLQAQLEAAYFGVLPVRMLLQVLAMGALIAWQSADVRVFYGGSACGGGMEDFGLFTIPTLAPFQALRGLLWVALLGWWIAWMFDRPKA